MTTITALPTPPSRDDPTNFRARADAFMGALPTFGTECNTVAGEVNAANSTASAAATAAGNSATAAANSATAAANSASSAAGSWASVNALYLGVKTSDPSTNNSGGALAQGAIYWNSATGLRVYSGGAWTGAGVQVTSASGISFTPAGGLAATNVQAALQELDSEKAAAGHGHAVADVTGLQAALDAKVGTAGDWTMTGNLTLRGDTYNQVHLLSGGSSRILYHEGESHNMGFVNTSGAWSLRNTNAGDTYVIGGLSVGGGTLIPKITISNTAPGTLAANELWFQF